MKQEKSKVDYISPASFRGTPSPSQNLRLPIYPESFAQPMAIHISFNTWVRSLVRFMHDFWCRRNVPPCCVFQGKMVMWWTPLTHCSYNLSLHLGLRMGKNPEGDCGNKNPRGDGGGCGPDPRPAPRIPDWANGENAKLGLGGYRNPGESSG